MGRKDIGLSPSKRNYWIGLLALLVAISCSGCGDPQKLSITPSSVLESNIDSALAPEFGADTRIALYSDDKEMEVGDNVEGTDEFFPKPRKVYPIRELPSTFGAKFSTRGWETDLEGFGIVAYQGRIAAAVRTIHKIDSGRIDEAVAEYSRRLSGLEPAMVNGRVGKYWFWERERDRLMICQVRESNGKFAMTIAVGELNTMDSLRMSPRFAAEDVRRADQGSSDPDATKP